MTTGQTLKKMLAHDEPPGYRQAKQRSKPKLEVLQLLTAVDERDPDTGVDGKPAVLPGDHVGSSRSVEQVSEPEPADHAAPYPLGDRSQISLRD